MSELSVFSNPMIRNQLEYTTTNTKPFSIKKKLAEMASFIIRTPHKEPLGGVTVRGCKGEPDEGPCGRSLGAPPWNEDSTVSGIILLKIKIINIIKKRLFRLGRNKKKDMLSRITLFS